MLENLIPISKKHSISRVVATIHIPQAFIKPQDLFDKAKEIEEFSDYPKKKLIKLRTININEKKLGITDEKIGGFIFENFKKDGSLNTIFKLENNREDDSSLSFDTREYSSWEDFKLKFKNRLKTFNSVKEFYVKAVSLNFRDEFFWRDNENSIPVDKIFNIESEILNKRFLKSKNGTLFLISQGIDNEGFLYEEKTEISFNNNIKRITIDHHYVTLFNEIKLFEELDEEIFNSKLEIAHDENKEILKSILTVNVLELIKLK